MADAKEKLPYEVDADGDIVARQDVINEELAPGGAAGMHTQPHGPLLAPAGVCPAGPGAIWRDR